MPEERIISADDHIYEPPHIFDSLPADLRALAPRPVQTENGDGWVLSPGDPPFLIGGAARHRKTPDEVWTTVVTFDNMAPGAYDPAARLVDMDLDGVYTQVLYPQIMRHGLRRGPNAEVRAAAACAYNKWISTFDAYDADRFVGLAVLPPLNDGPVVIEILREAHALGLRGAWLTTDQSGKPLHHPDFEEFWTMASDLEMPISLHIDTFVSPFSRAMPEEYRSLPGNHTTNLVLAGVALAEPLCQLILSGTLDRHRNLRVVLAESGIGWIPYIVDRMDDLWYRQKGRADAKNERVPSEIATDQIYATFERDLSGLLAREIWGIDNIMWASDYPHMTSTFPHSMPTIDRLFERMAPHEKRKVVCENAAGLYRLEAA